MGRQGRRWMATAAEKQREIDRIRMRWIWERGTGPEATDERSNERYELAAAGGMVVQNEHVDGGSKVRPGLSHWPGHRRSNQVRCQAPSSLASLDWRHALIILVSRGAIRGANLLESSLRSQAFVLRPPLPPCRESTVRTLHFFRTRSPHSVYLYLVQRLLPGTVETATKG